MTELKDIVEEFEYSMTPQYLTENTALYNSLSDHMSISLDKYISCLPKKQKSEKEMREKLIEVLDYSPNFCYNKSSNMIELRTRPLKDVVVIDTKSNPNLIMTDDIKKLLENWEKNVLSKTVKQDSLELRIVSEQLSKEFLELLLQHKVEARIESENMKDRIMGISTMITNKEKHNTRKLSEQVEGGMRRLSAHKNSFSEKRFKMVEEEFGYRGKKSFNKYDEVCLNQYVNLVSASYKETSQKHKYSFKEMSAVFWDMKLAKAMTIPSEWESSYLEEIMTKTPRQDMEHFKKEKKSNNFVGNRERANTHMYQFKGYNKNHKKSYNDEYWNVKRNNNK